MTAKENEVSVYVEIALSSPLTTSVQFSERVRSWSALEQAAASPVIIIIVIIVVVDDVEWSLVGRRIAAGSARSGESGI